VLQAPDDKATGWVVEVTGDKVRLVPVGAGAPVPAGKSLQFWTKPEGAAGPTSLGLVRAGVITELPIARLPAVQAQTLFELTLEPEAGSPLPRPTGPILYVGRSVRL
jgi:anti-sigma-K factor RskA